jgi:hypothetical protein
MRGGRYLEIEVKTGKDRLSALQMLRRENIERAGGFYIVATSFDDFETEFLALTSTEKYPFPKDLTVSDGGESGE